MVNIAHYVDEKILENEGRWKVCQLPCAFFPSSICIEKMFLSLLYFQGSEKVRELPLPEELVFTVDEKVLSGISQAKAQYLKEAGVCLSLKIEIPFFKKKNKCGCPLSMSS